MPWIRLRRPDGQEIGSNWGPLVGQIDVLSAPLTGTYTVIIGSADSGRDAAGDYRLTLAMTPGTPQVSAGDEGGVLKDGANPTGHIHVGDLDQWTFAANKGDAISVSVGETLDAEIDPGFTPWIRLRRPDGGQLGSTWGPWVGQIDVASAPLTGTYTVVIGTADSGRDAEGDYQLTLARSPATYEVPAGDEGGPLGNGTNEVGHIHIGDLDQWHFTAAAGDAIALSVGEIPDWEIDPGFVPWLRLRRPDGMEIGSTWGPWVAQIDVKSAPLSGVYTVIVGTADSGRDAAGTYRLTRAHTPGTFTIPSGDEGGPLTEALQHKGAIHLGDLDQWTFSGAKDHDLTVTMTEINIPEIDPGFWPWIRLRAPDGSELGSSWGALVAQIKVKAPMTGLYTVVAGTADSGRDATGEYQLQVIGSTGPSFTVTPVAGPGGTISPSTAQQVLPGGQIDFTVTPAPGYVVAGVSGCAVTPVGGIWRTGGATADCTVTATFMSTSSPMPEVSPASAHFAAVTTGSTFISQTSAQALHLSFGGPGTVSWTATTDQPWVTLVPAAGVGPGDLTVGVTPGPGVPVGTTLGATVTLHFVGASVPTLAVPVTLATLAPGTTASPFGFVDTPADNSAGVTGAVPFTGWGLDDVEVDKVTICRDAVAFEAAGPDPQCGGAPQIYVGRATFIERARPDVEAGYPALPRSSRAGWGFMVLTNMLPDIPRGLPTGGNGTFRFSMYAHDPEGHAHVLGTRTITTDNDHATLPFGTIDTPGQGATASGSSYVNFGWVLTQNPKFVPTDGSTIHVYVDGVDVGNASYNHYRPDIATFFPGLANSNGAVGFRIIDTTALANGLHVIAWGASDNTGAFSGLGSRFFLVDNPATALTVAPPSADAAVTGELAVTDAAAPTPTAHAQAEALARRVGAAPVDRQPLAGRRGWQADAAWQPYPVTGDGRTLVRGEEMDRLELFLGAPAGARVTSYLRIGGDLAALPAGSRLDPDTGIFTWTPGVGFVGAYDLAFVRWHGETPVSRRDVRVALAPRGSHLHGPQVTVDRGGTAAVRVGEGYALTGWAADLDDPAGSGIDTLHVWAYPLSGEAPIFVGTATQGLRRPDVADLFGAPFGDAGYALDVRGLAAGAYDLAVFGWSRATGGFLPAATVRIVVQP